MGNTCSHCVAEDSNQAEAVRDQKPTDPGSPATVPTVGQPQQRQANYIATNAKPGVVEVGQHDKEYRSAEMMKLRDPAVLQPTPNIIKLIQTQGLPPWEEDEYSGKANPIELKQVDRGTYYGQVDPETKKLHGRGQLLVNQSPICLHVGYFRDDQKHGPGRTYLDTNQYIEADWENDVLHGNCLYKNPSEGQWSRHQYVQNKKHGHGEEHWPDGTYFKGEYRNGQKHGQGEMHWPDGNRYEGEFFNGHIQGKGTYTWSDGKTYSGDWVNNKMHGKGEFRWPDGRVYKGEYKDDLKDGFGVFEWNKEKRYEGNWSKGKQHGKGVYINDKGERKEKIFNNGNY